VGGEDGGKENDNCPWLLKVDLSEGKAEQIGNFQMKTAAGGCKCLPLGMWRGGGGGYSEVG